MVEQPERIEDRLGGGRLERGGDLVVGRGEGETCHASITSSVRENNVKLS
jgi:hypothetical protein